MRGIRECTHVGTLHANGTILEGRFSGAKERNSQCVSAPNVRRQAWQGYSTRAGHVAKSEEQPLFVRQTVPERVPPALCPRRHWQMEGSCTGTIHWKRQKFSSIPSMVPAAPSTRIPTSIPMK